MSFLLGKDKTDTINEHKDKRIDAQYYMKVDQTNKVGLMLKDAQNFISNFDEVVSNLSDKEIKEFRARISILS